MIGITGKPLYELPRAIELSNSSVKGQDISSECIEGQVVSSGGQDCTNGPAPQNKHCLAGSTANNCTSGYTVT